MFTLIESLETRRMYAAAPTGAAYGNTDVLISASAPGVTAHVTKNGTLVIQGTSKNDTISLSTTAPTNVAVAVTGTVNASNGVAAGLVYLRGNTKGQTGDVSIGYDLSLVKRVQIEGGAGNDDIRLGIDVKLKATILGGKGNDVLIGGPLGDSISGGAGNDSISAAAQQAVFASVAPYGSARLISRTLTPVTEDQPNLGGKLFIPGAQKQPTTLVRFVNLSTQMERQDSADLLEGNAGDDTIRSGVGPDTVNGGTGADTLVAPDRGKAPKNLLTSGETPVDYNGLTVISMEKQSDIAIFSRQTIGGSLSWALAPNTIVVGTAGDVNVIYNSAAASRVTNWIAQG